MALSILKIKSLDPYIGPRPYARNKEDQERFFGRNSETDRIISLIFSHQIVLIYAQSGAGKTSIFNGQIIPKLESEGFEVLPVSRVGMTYIEKNKGDSNSYNKCTNIYVFNALHGILSKLLNTNIVNHQLLDISINNFLKKYYFNLKTKRGKPKPKLLIFDQLEELFNYYPQNWQDQQRDFFRQVNEALTNDPSLRIVLIIREDYIGQLNPFKELLPEKLRPSFRMERLNKDAAFRAIEGPLEKRLLNFNIKDFEDDLNRIINDLLKIKVETFSKEGKIIKEETGNYVEPIHLQVVCQRWWKERIKNEKNVSEFNFLVNVDVALEDFYVEVIRESSIETNVSEDRIREWCSEQLITPNETRGLVYQGERLTDGLPNEVVEILTDKYLLRRELRAGGTWFELTHDRMIKPIKDSNLKWFNEKRKKEDEIRERKARHLKIVLSIITAAIVVFTVVFILIINPYLNPPIPEAQNGNITTFINSPINFTLPSSSQSNAMLKYHIISKPVYGHLLYNGSIIDSGDINSNLTYHPYFRYIGPDSLTFTVSNGKRNSTNVGVVDILVKNVPLDPINQNIETIVNKPIKISLFEVDHNMLEQIRSNDTIPFRILEEPSHGFLSVEISSNKAIYTPTQNYVGEDNFTFCMINTTLIPHQCTDMGEVDLSIKKIPQYFGYLVSTNGLTQGTVYPLYSTSLTIGRVTSQDMPDISIVDTNLDRSVSRLHARLFIVNSTFTLQDLGSSFHTIKLTNDNHKILDMNSTIQLNENDTFKIGSMTLKYIKNNNLYNYGRIMN